MFYFLHSTQLLSFYIGVVLILSISEETVLLASYNIFQHLDGVNHLNPSLWRTRTRVYSSFNAVDTDYMTPMQWVRTSAAVLLALPLMIWP